MAYTDIKFRVVLETSQAKQGLQEVEKAGEKVGTAIQKIGSTSGQTGSVMMGMNNVIRDSRYGFIGVYNNITQVMDGFGHLKNSAGGTMNALKQVGASIMGAGGLMLAFNLLLAYYPEIIAFFQNSGEQALISKKAMEEYKKQVEGIANSIIQLKDSTANIQMEFSMQGLHNAIGGISEQIRNAKVDVGFDYKKKEDLKKSMETSIQTGADYKEINKLFNKEVAILDIRIKSKLENIAMLETEAKRFDGLKKEEELRLKMINDLKTYGATEKIKEIKVKPPKFEELNYDMPVVSLDLLKQMADFSKEMLRQEKEKWQIAKAYWDLQGEKGKAYFDEINEKNKIALQNEMDKMRETEILEGYRLERINNLRDAWLGLGDTMANVFSQMGGDLNKVGSTMQKIMQVMRIIQQMEASQKMLASGDISKEGNIVNQITGFLGAFGAGTSKNIVNNSGSTTVAVNLGGETVNKIMINNSSMISKRKVQLGVA